MERLHPITRAQEVAVDIEIAAIVAIGFCTQRFDDVRLVQVLCDPVELLVAQTSPVSALDTNVIRVLARALVRAYDGVVAIDRSSHAGKDIARDIAAFNEISASRDGVVHRTAFAFVEHGGPAAFAAGHGAVIIVLRQRVC